MAARGHRSVAVSDEHSKERSSSTQGTAELPLACQEEFNSLELVSILENDNVLWITRVLERRLCGDERQSHVGCLFNDAFQ
jgi:hypothetical protein